MSDKFYPIPAAQLLQLVLNEHAKKQSIFGIPDELFFNPKKSTQFTVEIFNQKIASPLGVAAGPHSQLAQNIIGAWLTGARYIELKTIQTLDELEISKPCIDMQDEGYNCEWSQELKIKESFSEYLNAWIIIHILNHKFGYNTDIQTIFNMSVGYNLEGIMKPNVQWFFEKMNDCSAELAQKVSELKAFYPEIEKITIPTQISNNITLSTMHGCPADEIESIAKYLLDEKNLHTFVKLNPTLLGPKHLREILNDKLKFKTNVPDIAFEHDLKYPDALNIIRALQATADKRNLHFGLKLTNTLESMNNKQVFGKDAEMMYMSGRALHPISINVAKKLQTEFGGTLQLSFSAGADAFNITDVVACGFKTVTVCSDILKPGGYMRLNQYFETLSDTFSAQKVSDIENFVKTSAKKSNLKDAALQNLSQYADAVLESDKYKRTYRKDLDIKTTRSLGYFDCISAPCRDTCATNQDIPDYLHYTSTGEYGKASASILKTNPFPTVTGIVCDHLCQNKCTRVNYDNSLLIREVKRFISDQDQVKLSQENPNGIKVAVIGAGPAGLSCAYYLALAGFSVEVFESQAKAGGMVQSAIPGFRLTDENVEKDINRVTELGVKIHYNHKIDKTAFETLRKNHNYMFVGAGAQLSAPYDLEGIDAQGVLDSLGFLFAAKKHEPTGIGNNVVIIGGGNTAMDAARTAFRLVGENGKVTIVYRRTINEMPADDGEINGVLEEGIDILELVAPEKVIVKNGKVAALLCSKMKLGEPDSSGRARPVKIEGSEFEIPCDTIIPAIGQSLDIDFVETEKLKADINTYQTTLDNIFIGGDALRGAATAIKAIGDGRPAAEHIMQKAKIDFNIEKPQGKHLSKRELMLRRAKRKFAPELHELDANDRKNFKVLTQTLDEKTIQAEAARCLQCDEICNICTTVCPNFANYSYETLPVLYQLKKAVQTENGVIEFTDDVLFEVKQTYQILNIANFCNECGNCNTFCPTNSAPYKEKPKFHLTRHSFDSSNEGYFVENGSKITRKHDGKLCSLTAKADTYLFDTVHFEAELSRADFSIKQLKFKQVGKQEAYFAQAAELSVLLHASADLVFEN